MNSNGDRCRTKRLSRLQLVLNDGTFDFVFFLYLVVFPFRLFNFVAL